MPSQLYEVDVFMFFLKDLEAVSNNFYHDLWQVARLHTPKVSYHACCILCCMLLMAYTCNSVTRLHLNLTVPFAVKCQSSHNACKRKSSLLQTFGFMQIPLAALASDSSAGFTSLIQHELAVSSITAACTMSPHLSTLAASYNMLLLQVLFSIASIADRISSCKADTLTMACVLCSTLQPNRLREPPTACSSKWMALCSS